MSIYETKVILSYEDQKQSNKANIDKAINNSDDPVDLTPFIAASKVFETLVAVGTTLVASVEVGSRCTTEKKVRWKILKKPT